jgi:hypothetical protein
MMEAIRSSETLVLIRATQQITVDFFFETAEFVHKGSVLLGRLKTVKGNL